MISAWILGVALAVQSGAAAPNGPPAAPSVPAPAAEVPLVAEARAFMDSYKQDLIAGDRPAVSARYDRRGTHMVIARAAKFLSHAEVSGIYADPRWTALPRFQWHDLMYIPAGPEAMVVAGRFSVQRGDTPIFYSYSNLLVRQDGQLRIRMEHETPEPIKRAAAE